MKEIRKLSQSYGSTLAHCEECDEYFIDDVVCTHGLNIVCPNGCGYCLIRGVKPTMIKIKGGLV